MDCAWETRCDRLMNWDRSCVGLVLRHSLVLLLTTSSFLLFNLTIALSQLFLLLSHHMLLSHVLFFTLSLALKVTIEDRRRLRRLAVHDDSALRINYYSAR
jgi:hypothetical protein